MAQDADAVRKWWEERIAKEAAEKDAKTGEYNPPPSDDTREIYDQVFHDAHQITVGHIATTSTTKSDTEHTTSSVISKFNLFFTIGAFFLSIPGIASIVAFILFMIFIAPLFRPSSSPSQVECNAQGSCQVITSRLGLGDPVTFGAQVGAMASDEINRDRLFNAPINKEQFADFVRHYRADPVGVYNSVYQNTEKVAAEETKKHEAYLKDESGQDGKMDMVASWRRATALLASCVQGGPQGQPLTIEQCAAKLGMNSEDVRKISLIK